MKKYSHVLLLLLAISIFITLPHLVFASYHFSDYRATPPIHIYGTTSKTPQGLTPSQIKGAYGLPISNTKKGHEGTIAIIGAYNNTSIEADLADFDKQFNLPSCTTTNGCFEKHLMSTAEKSDSGWALETTLDVEWAHAVDPYAKILLVSAVTPSGSNLLKAVDYAAARSDVTAVSMSWGGPEFSEETTLDSHFKSKSGAVFFASSGDHGTGASWPASSPNVVAVGGTSLTLTTDGAVKKETAWSGSGGGVSAYEKQPAYQSDYSIPKSGGFRAIPDVAYNADPATGFSIVRAGIWRVVGGTSAGAPQWAALATLGTGANNQNFYTDKASSNHALYFQDITSGTNGTCGFLCTARKNYDYVTGLGSPRTSAF